MLSTIPSSTSWSASTRKAQCSYPSGTGVQVIAIRWASPRPSNFRLCPGRGSSCSAFSKPPVTYRLRMRSTHGRLTFKAAIICGSVNPSLAFNNIIARLNSRAFALPFRVRSSNCNCSFSLYVIRYFFLAIVQVFLPWIDASSIPSYSK
jgi:hypothetical protein